MCNKTLRPFVYLLLAVSAIVTTGCTSFQSRQPVKVTLLHINDVYEIAPTNNGKSGGLARVATLRKQLLKQNPNTLTFIGGDFFSPSAMGTANIDGEPLAGKQMVDVLNALGLDYATFGNHEFDLKRAQFYQRMSESRFHWISGNVRDEHDKPFAKVNAHEMRVFKNQAGDKFKLGMFGITLNANQPDYVSYRDAIKSAGEQIEQLVHHSDFILALTHQAISDDERLANTYPATDLILGGHEHENYQRWRGNNTPILKADANARSVYVVNLSYNPGTGKTTISPRLVFIDDSMTEDPVVKSVVEQWTQKVFDAFREQGFEPTQVLATTTEPLDGLETSIRNHSTGLTRLIAQSMLQPYPKAELSIYNSGSIRIDDILPPGEITVYDIIRTLPFGGSVVLVEMKGSLLEKVLTQGLANAGSGGYLQWANTERVGETWQINSEAISDSRAYRVAIADFLLGGRESGLDYLTPDNPDLTVLKEGKNTDIRKLVADRLKSPGQAIRH